MEHVYHCTGHQLKIPDIVDSHGVYVIDRQGKRYMDLESGVWCVSLGHNNEQVKETLTGQIDALVHAGFCYSSQILEESSKSVLDITGFAGGKSVFLCSGSEAIEISRQIAKHVSGKNLSMTLHDSYVGAYTSASDRTRDWYIFDWGPCETCTRNENCDLSCEALRDISENISDFVFEPGSSSGFVRFPPKALIENIINIVQRNGGKVIANEVTTGVGRTGKWFGYQHYDVEPDMVALGKGIGNGYPVSVAAINKVTIDELARNPFKYSQSHLNDPLGAAIVREVIRTIESNDLVSESMRKGSVFLSQLESLVDNNAILSVRGRGLMFALDLADEDTASQIHDELISNGYIVGNRGTSFRIDPPLVITENEFMEFIDTFKAVIAEKHKST